ncbi:hypothetical protein HWV62_42000 [Athelia sp. TMB]|nr:hypothetical protein HWV62_42000 [Athelia sp. TMB]
MHIYVLDPLESATPAPSSSAQPQVQGQAEISKQDAGGSPHGVAVGLGLMSWALLAEEEEGEEACVTGTLVTAAGVQSLQVVFALRETTRMHKANLSPALKSWGRPPTHDTNPTSATNTERHQDPSIQASHNQNHISGSRTPVTPPRPQSAIPGSDPACAIDLTASPSPQRPRSTFLSQPVPMHSLPLTTRPLVRAADLPLIYGRPGRPPASLSVKLEKERKDRERGRKRAEAERDRVHLPPGDRRGKEWKRRERAAMENSPVAQRHQQQRENEHIMRSENSPSQEQTAHSALLAALASIDAGAAGEAGVNPALVSALRGLLESASVPSASAKTTESAPEEQQGRRRTRSTGAVLSDGDDADADDPDYMDDDEEDGEDEPAPTPTQDKATEKENVSPKAKSEGEKKRKRRLSDFMEQKEREREAARKRRSFGGSAANANSAGGSTAAHPHSEGMGTRVPGVYYDPFGAHARTSPAPRPPTVPVGLGITGVFGNGFPRAMSFGSTASTSDAPSPAPQDESIATGSQAEREQSKKKFVLPAWAKTNTVTQPRLSEAALRAQREKVEEEKEARRKRNREEARAKKGKKGEGSENVQRVPIAKPREQPKEKPTHSSPGLPICASSDVTVVAASSPRAPPQTPPPRTRRKHMLTPLTKSGGSALFTPSPRKVSGGGAGLFDSPLYSPCARASAKKRFSPIRMQGWLSASKTKDAAEGQADDEDDKDESERLARELESELDSEAPSSSLPVASSDTEAEPPTTSSSGGHLSLAIEAGANADADDDGNTTMRFWTAGLPPSSPPPPSSPVLRPQDDDPFTANWMSDSDGLAFEYDSDAPMNLGEPVDDFYASSSDGPTMSFDEFTQLFSEPVTAPDAEPDVLLQSTEFDFGQFWETMKPLIGQQAAGGVGGYGGQTAGMGEGVDPVKLAEDVHALFSGCLM